LNRARACRPPSVLPGPHQCAGLRRAFCRNINRPSARGWPPCGAADPLAFLTSRPEGRYQTAWHDRDRDGVQIKLAKGKTVDTLGGLAERMLTAFQASDFARPEGMILGVEEELRGLVVPGCPDLLARIDLIVEGKDGLDPPHRIAWGEPAHEHALVGFLVVGDLHVLRIPEQLPAGICQGQVSENQGLHEWAGVLEI
jgi:hypothetical protein